MPCTLSAYGDEFDVDRFLEHTTLEFYRVWHKGEPLLPRSKPEGPTTKSSGVMIEIGDRDEFDNLKVLVRAATEYLRTHEAELLKLGEAVGEKWFVLGFGIRWRAGIAVYTDGIPPELCLLAGRIGAWIAIDHYWMEEGKPTRRFPERGPVEDVQE